jgi:phosphohistidine phosphatase SixA
MNVYLVRHGKAGDRMTWEGDDRARPLTRAGRRQAEAIATMLAREPVEHLVTSPYVRCIETLVPLASQAARSLEMSDALAEGATLEQAWSLVRKFASEGAVLCTHGDVVPMLLGHLEARGVAIGDDPQWPKGSMWILNCEADDVVAARYVAPPAIET